MLRALAKGINYLLGDVLNKSHIILTGSLAYLERERKVEKSYFDYIRLASLELLSYEIKKKKLAGNAAELGVYKGKFARYINQYFPDRTLYLFDTFEGFDNRDIASETKEKFSNGEQDFSNTSVDTVMAAMPFPEKCMLVKGFFPESAVHIDDSFVFVSLDTDLYEPVYNGLRFFYPKLVSGGYIFVHDFNNDAYKGSRRAVEQFCAEERINYFPLPDLGGSAVIMK